uniref:Uncharacterized protein LOC102806264 n=1 Tax=Saccoglossus kowalevskii TaxID=10224 RepID=A0ABM0LXS1_SACKO
MAMEKQYTIKDTHSRAITALGYHPLRREILAGCEDGFIKTWEAESSLPVMSSHEHQGWVTDFLYWTEPKLLFSSSNDGSIIAWASGGGVHDKMELGAPVYTISMNYKRHQLVCGFNASLKVYELDENKESGHVIDLKSAIECEETQHTDIIRCVLCNESRIYSAGYDGCTSRRHVIVWKYNPSGCITALQCRHNVDSLTYTSKAPILIFNGGSDGNVHKWERLQSNHFMYSKETFPLGDAKSKVIQIKNILKKESEGQQRPKTAPTRSHQSRATSYYTFNKPIMPASRTHQANVAHLKSIFVETLDLLLVASEDSNIYVWGFDDDAVNALQHMKPEGQEDLIKKYGILLPRDSLLLPRKTLLRKNYLNAIHNGQENDSVTNRVAGFVCKNVLMAHHSVVTCMAVVPKECGFKTSYMISGGWDRRICIWDLEKGLLHDCFRNTNPGSFDKLELACDGIIIDMDYSPKRNEFAYASSDKMVYIRKFSEDGRKMTLCNTLQGHYGEITQVRWNPIKNTWITGSEDGTIRIWSEDGMNCEQVLATHGTVTALCIDNINGAIIAGVGNNV